MSELINNSQERKRILKELIKSLHEGKTVDDVKAEFQKHFGSVSTAEITAVEQELVKEGLPAEEIQRLCDVHAAVYEGRVEDIHPTRDYSKVVGHPAYVFDLENRAIERLIDSEIIPYLQDYLAKPNNNSYLLLRIAMDQLATIDIHYKRKEYLFFPVLEKRGITAPPKVMWGVDDEIRADIKNTIDLLNSIDATPKRIEKMVTNVVTRIKDMIFKEDNILMPLLADTFNLLDWIRIDEATEEFGYTLIEKPASWKVQKEEAKKETQPETEKNIGEVTFDAGHLSPLELNSLLNTLPFDLTFVDANNQVKYFTCGNERIFERPKTIIGRNVSLCHPPHSVHVVEGIIEDFRSGKKDHEDFWIRFKDQFVMIRYFAVRDKEGNYLGTLEVTQNIKPITELQGEKRLVSE